MAGAATLNWKRSTFKQHLSDTRWAPTSYKWSYKFYKWSKIDGIPWGYDP